MTAVGTSDAPAPERAAPAGEALDRLARLAARTLRCPLALLLEVVEGRLVVRGGAGLPGEVRRRRDRPVGECTPRHPLLGGRELLVEDVRLDPDGAPSPLLAALGAVAFAGVPLLGARGEVLGSLGVADRQPRRWSGGDLELLQELAAVAVEQIRWRAEVDEHQRTAESLRESEKTFRSLIENSSDVIAVLSAGGIVRYESPAVGRVLGYPRGALVGKSAWELVHPQDVSTVIQRFTAIVTGHGCAGAYEVRLRHRDGGWGTFEARANNLLGDPAVGGVVVTARDLTAQQRAEENRSRLGAILDATPDFVATLDPHGRALYINPAGRQMLGVEERDVPTLTIAELYPHPTTSKVVAEGIPAAMREGVWSAETSFLASDGTEIPVAQVLLAHRSPQGTVEFMSIVARSIGEQQRAEAALRRSEEHFRSLIENATDVVHVMDADGVIRYVSPSVERVVGYAVEELIGRNAFEIVHPEQREFARGSFAIRLDEGEVGPPVELLVRRKDGEWRTFEMRANNLLADPAVGGVVVNSRDVTDRKQAESALAESQEQLLQSQKMEAVGRLAGGVAHDFNNLLTAIKGFTELLLLDFDERDPRRSFATEIQGAANRAAGLTRQLLAFSRKQVLQPKVLDLREVVADMEKMLRRLIGEDVQLETAPAAHTGRIKADPGQIEQVLLNLAVNARDAMPTGGRLAVEIADATLTAEQIPASAEIQPGPYVMLAVRDTGCGMSREVQERIFEPFFTTKEKGKGTGLGLSTVYGIVKQSGGMIQVESEPGAGTAFRIFLPAVREKVEKKVARAAAGPMEGSERVLLVEDEVAVRVLVRRVLDRMGYRVLEAASGAAAVALLEQQEEDIDLLLTDVVMPGMSGRELADQLCERYPHLKVLYMSGYTDEAIVHHGVLEPGVAFLEKPFTPDVLLRRLREVLDSPARAGAGQPLGTGR